MLALNTSLPPLLAFSVGPFGAAELLVIMVIFAVPVLVSVGLIWLILKLSKKSRATPPVLPPDPEAKDL